MLVNVPQAGVTGVNADLTTPNLPPNAWTAAQNIRFLDGSAVPAGGHSPIYAANPVAALHVLPVTVAGVRSWIYAGTQKIYITQSVGGIVTHTPLTRQTAGADVNYTGVANAWTSTLLGGVPILNNGVDVPQMWLLSLTTPATALTAWPATYTCRVIRAFKNSLIALGVTKAGVDYPYMVKWSHPADPGTVPVTWDTTDATKDAGEIDLADGYDKIVDGLPLRGSFIIYKESSIWRMDFTGGPFVYAFTKALGLSGALNRNCIVEIDGQHLVLTGSDVIVHDGHSSTSVLDKQTRRTLFSRINPLAIGTCFVFKNPFYNEVFVCYPDGSDVMAPNRAMVWNYKDRTVSFRDLPGISHAATGAITSSLSDAWSADLAPWAEDLTTWNQIEFNPERDRVIFAAPSLYLLDSTSKFNGAAPVVTLERVGINLGTPAAVKTVTSIRPLISGNPGRTVMVSVGGSMDQYTGFVWSTPVAFTIGSSVSIDTFATGRDIGVRFSGGTALSWKLDSYQLEVKEKGGW